MSMMGTDEVYSDQVTTCTQPPSRFIDAQAFLELAVSRKQLMRADDAQRSIRGLLDPATGVRYAIREEMLEQSAELLEG